MESIYKFSDAEFLAFFLVLLRLSAFIIAWPVFGGPAVPAPAKILFALTLTIVVFPLVGWGSVRLELNSMQILWLAGREVFIGVTLGFLARLFFFAINICGQIVSSSIGLANGSMFNPEFGGNISSLEQLQIVIATLFFLAINGHHLFLNGIVESFRLVPLSAEGVNAQALATMGQLVQDTTVMGLKLSAPVMVSLLAMNIIMGVIGRTVPQINVLVTSMPVNIMLGLAVLVIAMPLMMWNLKEVLDLTADRLFQVLKAY